jgi:hypothetical protein
MSLLHHPLGRKPLVSFATTNRARLAGNTTGRGGAAATVQRSLVATGGSKQMPPVTRKRSAAAAKRRVSNKVRFVKGRVQLRVAGYSGTKYLSPSHLVRHIAPSKLRIAAKLVLKQTERGGTTKKRKRRKGKNSQKRGKKRTTKKKKSKKRRKRTY